jgi:hypothetical protein
LKENAWCGGVLGRDFSSVPVRMDTLSILEASNGDVSSLAGGVTSPGRELPGVPRKVFRMLHRFLF